MKVAVTLGGLRNASEDCYLAALRQAGLEPVPLYPDAPVAAVLATVEGLVLSGGPDVHPSRYGEAIAGSQVNEASALRDAAEFAALAEADAAGLPVLAICRGAQVLNVHRGGALLQDIGEAHRDGRPQEEKWRAFHEVEVDGVTRLAEALGATDTVVNSRHHQAIDPERVGEGLLVVARCPIDGVVEAVESSDPSRFVLGVQWHPENMALGPDDTMERDQARAIFEAFAAVVRERAALVAN